LSSRVDGRGGFIAGKLEAKLDEQLGDRWRGGGEERTVAVGLPGDPFRVVG
jgi:hypothetical protein